VEGVAVVGERGGSEAERGVRRFEVDGGVGVLHRGHGVGEKRWWRNLKRKKNGNKEGVFGC